ncbi:MAG: hypothetical protein ACHQJ6_02025 [Candidatus Berkiellales bacterium]
MDKCKKIGILLAILLINSCSSLTSTPPGTAADLALSVVTLPIKIVGVAIGAAIGAAAGMGMAAA